MAVIQPLFIPYAGYFRLFAAADVVVIFDCVQFPRRGWIHRNRLMLATGEIDWFTLPIVKTARDTLIRELKFPADVRERLTAAARRFPVVERAMREQDPLVERVLDPQTDDVTSYLIELLQLCNATLGLERPLVRSSSLPIPADIHAQDRVIAILNELGATAYVNPSGGRDLYDHATFNANGMELGFLAPYTGSLESILGRILNSPSAEIAAEIRRETVVHR